MSDTKPTAPVTAPTRECKGCGGSGDTRPHMPTGLTPLTREQWRDRVYGDAFLCPACLGTGRQSDVIPARDAMVDAETLRQAHHTERRQ